MLRALRPDAVLFASCLTVFAAGCGAPDDGSTDFSTYTGNAVEVPYDSDGGAVDIGDSSGGGNSGTGINGDTSGGTTAGTGSDNSGSAGTTGGEDDAGISTGGGSGDPTTGGTPGGGGTGAMGTLSFSVLTSAVGGKYQPRNVGAIWIETSSGKFVKTLKVWAASRERYLTKFVAAGRSRVDAITGATLRSHTTHSVQWDSTDVSGNVVADGDYRVVVEITDKNSTGDSVVVPFTKGASAVSQSPSDATHFKNMTLSYQ